ncbi:MAG: DUF2791 family P-loop domain-containing protein [Deltaproteobacteria bacterium]|nr:DUF2791 family P-loop domain-containing protein [Deltaproteobacteria bacterium]
MSAPSRRWARRIIEVLGAHGIPPESGLQHFSVGLDPWLKVLENDYLRTFIGEDGGAAFKLVVGAYGGGKTHFLYTVRELAWRQGYAVAYVPLSGDETPFHRMELVYASVARSLTGPRSEEQLFSGYEKGLGALLAEWTAELLPRTGGEPGALDGILDGVLDGVENVNFSRALRAAIHALARRDAATFERMKGWLTVQGFDRLAFRDHGILRSVDRSNAFSVLRSLVQFLRAAGYTGLVVLFDEAEVVPSMSSRDRQHLLANLRELIDSCGHNEFRGTMFFYAVPDYGFFEGRLNVYEALRQRLSSVFEFDNPTGVAIELERTAGDPQEALEDIGGRLYDIYCTAYGWTGDRDVLVPRLQALARDAWQRRGGDIGYKRLFVKGAVRLFHAARAGRLDALDDEEPGGGGLLP